MMTEKYSYNGKEFDSKENGIDYNTVYEYTCMSCNYSWRLTMLAKNSQCPKCKGIRIYYMSKRSCDDFINPSEIIMPPENSELL